MVVPPATVAPLGEKVLRGALWTTCGALLNKGITLVGQVGLAWFLVPDDFGLVAIALSLTALAAVFTSGGLQTILVQKSPRDFDRLAGQCFWLSLVLNTLAGLSVLALAPAAEWLFTDKRLTPLVAIVGLTLPLGALTTIYTAKLYADLRFKAMALLQLGEGAVYTASAVILAYNGFGPYALVLPQLWVRLVAALTSRLVAGRIAIGRPHPSTWLVLVAPASLLMFQSMLNAIQSYGPSFVIGLFHSPREAGLYFWSYQLSAQAVFLMAVQLRQVLFPSFSKLNQEEDRQFAGFRSGLQTLNALTIPICVVQASLADPVIHLVFGDRWQAAIPVVQWLSVGMAATPLQVLGNAILMARGQFAALTLGSTVAVVLMLVACLTGSILGESPMIALCTAAAAWLANGFTLFLACRSMGKPWGPLVLELRRPLILAALATSFALLFTITIQHSAAVRMASAGAIFILFYTVGSRVFLREEFGRLFRLLQRKRP